MNQTQALALLRQTLLMLSAGFVTKGYVDDATLQILVSAIVALATVAWGLYDKRKAGAIAAAARETGVEIQVTDQALADSLPPNVRGPDDKPVVSVTPTKGTDVLTRGEALRG